MQIINNVKEELGDTLCHNDKMREEERVRMDEMREQEFVRMAHITIIIFLNPFPQITHWKYRIMNQLFQEEGKYHPNQ